MCIRFDLLFVRVCLYTLYKMENIYQPIFAHFPSINRQYGSMLSLSSPTSSSSHYATNTLCNAPVTHTSTPAYALHNNVSIADTQTADDDATLTMDQQHRGSFVYGMRPRRARSRLCKHLGNYIAAARLSAAISLDRLDFDEYDEVVILRITFS